jgi:hypothetical protein
MSKNFKRLNPEIDFEGTRIQVGNETVNPRFRV